MLGYIAVLGITLAVIWWTKHEEEDATVPGEETQYKRRPRRKMGRMDEPGDFQMADAHDDYPKGDPFNTAPREIKNQEFSRDARDPEWVKANVKRVNYDRARNRLMVVLNSADYFYIGYDQPIIYKGYKLQAGRMAKKVGE